MSCRMERIGTRNRRPFLLRIAWTCIAVGVLFLSPSARAEAPKLDGNLAVILVRDAITALNQANLTGNYTVLRDYASPNFASVNDPAKLAAIFARIRTQQLNLAPTLILAPQFTRAEMTDNGRKLRLSGFFPSRPKQVDFDLVFEPIEDRWRLFGISVAASDASQAVSQSPVPPAQPESVVPETSFIPVPVPRPLN